MKSKICGISDSKTLKYLTSHSSSPQYIGFIINYSKSKRFVENNKLKKLLKVKMMLIILNIFIVSNINIKSKRIDKSKLNRLKSERINKVYKYIKMPLLYE